MFKKLKRTSLITELSDLIDKLDLAHPSPLDRKELINFLIQLRIELIQSKKESDAPETELKKQAKAEAMKIAEKLKK